ncbi:MAG: polyprenol monophosphomannose synthase [Candidatus Diapherotrites archaeon]
MEVSVVIPTYNEAGNIETLVRGILAEFSAKKISGEVVVVDDYSPDGTGAIVEKIGKKYGNVRLVAREKKEGIGEALKAGFAAARGDVVITMDADLSHDPKGISQLLAKSGEGYGIVIGSRYVSGGRIENWPAGRLLASRGANMLSRVLLGIGAHDVTSGYRAYGKGTLRAMGLEKIKSAGYAAELELLYRAIKSGAKVAEVPIAFRQRGSGKSKLGVGQVPAYVKTVIRLFLGF